MVRLWRAWWECWTIRSSKDAPWLISWQWSKRGHQESSQSPITYLTRHRTTAEPWSTELLMCRSYWSKDVGLVNIYRYTNLLRSTAVKIRPEIKAQTCVQGSVHKSAARNYLKSKCLRYYTVTILASYRFWITKSDFLSHVQCTHWNSTTASEGFDPKVYISEV